MLSVSVCVSASSADGKLMRMHTAVRLNMSIRNKSGKAGLVIINFPAPPAKLAAEENCILEAITSEQSAACISLCSWWATRQGHQNINGG